jgi:hypothetical protein
MSIAAVIAQLEAGESIRRYMPARTRLPAKRALFLTRRAMRDFDDPHSPTNFFSNPAQIIAAMDRWVLGQRVWSVERRGQPPAGGFLKRLDPPPHEVWEVRVVEPRPQVRLVGRFAEKDTLLLTGFYLRDRLGDRGSAQWAAAMSDCDNDWNLLFPGIPSFAKATIHEYVSENCDDYAI